MTNRGMGLNISVQTLYTGYTLQNQSARYWRTPVPLTQRFQPAGDQPLEIAVIGSGIADGKIWLSVYPRVLGYQFNPLTVWYCHDRNGDLNGD